MKRIIAIFGLLLAGCDSSQAEIRSVDFFLKNPQERDNINDQCFKNQNSLSECENSGRATVLANIQNYKPEEFSIEQQLMKPNAEATMTANIYCIQNTNLEKSDPNHYISLPLNDPICQNHLTAVKQGYEKCLTTKSDLTLASPCGYFKMYSDEIKHRQTNK